VPTVAAEPEVDLGQALIRVARGLVALKLSPQAFGYDDRIDRAAYLALQRIADLGPVRLSDVATALCLDISTVSRQVRTLEESGLVARTVDPADRRAAQLVATDSGRDLVTKMQSTLSRIVDVALGDWSERERAALTKLLHRLADDLSPDRAPALVAAVR
jgi:DNA-binding MarR family transcriptional regulator